jgi:eukaryotic-like serine/threonine-protein kinase
MLTQGDIVAGRYQIEEYLENLINGWFYRAYDMREKQTVLFKWYSEIPGTDGKSWTRWHDRYVAEISVADKLNHPSIARLLDYGEAKDYSYIVLEYDSSRTLRDLLTEEKQLSIQDSLQYALEIADALSRVHHIGKLHGDIQPAAVLLYVDGVRRGLRSIGL